MAKTSISSGSAYASGADLLLFYNANEIAQLVTDDGTQDPDPANNAAVAAWLLAASGAVEAACVRGGRYLPVDLAALSGAGEAFLKKLVCSLAFWYGWNRKYRTGRIEDCPGAEHADEVLQRLSNGDAVFAFDETVDAGGMSTVDLRTRTDDRPRASATASRYFGRRSDDFTVGG